jgi:hypothetical protein
MKWAGEKEHRSVSRLSGGAKRWKATELRKGIAILIPGRVALFCAQGHCILCVRNVGCYNGYPLHNPCAFYGTGLDYLLSFNCTNNIRFNVQVGLYVTALFNITSCIALLFIFLLALQPIVGLYFAAL